MTHFTVTFVFSVPLNPSNSESKPKERRNSKNAKNTETFVSQKSLGAEELLKNVIHVGSILADTHVEYELLPGYKFAFDCTCWDGVAKIYFEDGERSLRPVRKNDTNWVVLSIHHLINFNKSVLYEFFRHTINFRIFPGRAKFSERARKDKTKYFYIEDEFLKGNPESTFAEVYAFMENGSLPKIDKFRVPDFPTTRVLNSGKYENPEVATYIEAIPDPVHHRRFWKKVENPKIHPKPVVMPSLKSSFSHMKVNGMKKKSRKVEKKEGKLKNPNYELTVPAEEFFAENGTVLRELNILQTSRFTSAAVYMHCKDLLKDIAVRTELKPLSINLEKLLYFPAEVLEDEGFIGLYARYKFLEHEVVTACYEPANTLQFRLVRTFLCSQIPPLSLVNSLLNEALIIEVYGIRESSGCRSIPENLAIHDYQRGVLLGASSFELAEVLQGHREITATNNLLSRSPPGSNEETSIVSEPKAPGDSSPLTSEIFAKNGTSVKLSIKIGASLRPLMQEAFRQPGVLNRIFIVLHDVIFAGDIFRDVLTYNMNILMTCATASKLGTEQESSFRMVTGFSIESVDKVIFLFEGPALGHILTIWERVMHLSSCCGYVLYNSNHLFVDRLYKDFLKFGGVIRIRLREPLEVHLRNCNLYLQGKKRRSWHRVPVILGNMMTTGTMRSLSQQKLFPLPQDLLDFGLELGYPCYDNGSAGNGEYDTANGIRFLEEQLSCSSVGVKEQKEEG